jgi:putative membrane protein
MMGWDGGFWPWAMGLPGLLWILLVAAVIFLLVRIALGRRRDPAGDTALEELGRQYAIGKIDREEFLRRKNDLA